ncbi:MAG: nucleotidyltransferase domain-containing protein [Chthonomonadetes bacterium]|nr:nucleotidyltransferase domain-containing protein [Chthonomonadetes bacterium]
MRRRLSEEQKAEVKRVLREALERIETVRFAYLFGSFLLKGTFEDVDVAVYLQPEALEGREPLNVAFDLADTLEHAIHLPVDVQILNTAPLALRFEALRGEPLMARCWEECADFVEQVTLQWWDTEGLRWAAVQ